MLLTKTAINCVLIHGWGMPLKIFDEFIVRCQEKINFQVVELPGDTSSSNLSSIDEYTDFVMAQINQPSIVLGWSLGGMIAINLAAKYPKLVTKLIMVTSTPKFVRTDDWQYGVEKQVLKSFHRQVLKNYPQTIQMFLGLQTMHHPEQKNILNLLKKLINDKIDLKSLSIQLDLLNNLDLRNILPTIYQPSLWISGNRDTLTPYKAAQYASDNMLNSKFVLLKNSGHLPFWTHIQTFDKLFLEHCLINETRYRKS